MNMFRREIEAELNELFEGDVELEVPNNLELGDYATPAALEEANRKGENPREYAEQIAVEFPTDNYDYVESVEVAGPGYINLTLDRTALGAQVLSETAEGFDPRDEKVIVEHTSPNPNKPLHMGTMRCAILGDAMARIADYLGYEVEVQNYINNLGRQTATTVYAYEEFQDELAEEDRARKADYWVGVLYSKAAQYLEENSEADDRVQQIIQDIEQQDTESFELMTELVGKSLQGQIETAHRSNALYNLIVFESDVVESGLFEETMDRLRELDKVYEITEGEDAGCTVIDMTDYLDELGDMEKPYKILVRSDGTATYTAKDIALTMWKFGIIDSVFGYEEYGTRPDDVPYYSTGGDRAMDFGAADKVFNVIGRPQAFPMQVIEAALRTLGFEEEADSFNHLDFKFVYLTGDALPEGAEEERVAYSGRKGNWMGRHGDAVLDRAYELAVKEIESRHPDRSDEWTEELADTVAVAAVRYFILKFSRKKDIEFSFDKIMDWQGDSGPYMLYSNARAHSVLEGVDVEPAFTAYEQDIEVRLFHELDRFDDVVQEAFKVQDAAKVANYMRELSETFSSFYHKCPVQQAETEELTQSRAALTEGFITVMEQGLELLGIESVKEL